MKIVVYFITNYDMIRISNQPGNENDHPIFR
jgi:hypothetical protein